MSRFNIPAFGVSKMEKTIQASTSQYDSEENNTNTLTCNECKTQFQKPIVATLTCQTGTQKYYACPYCLAEIRQTQQPHKQEQPKAKETHRPKPPPVTPATRTTQETTQTGCTHNIGYLKTRPKNTPIPDECLTCDKMVDCMLH